MIRELDAWGVKFQKTASGDFDVKKVHHKGSYVLPMPEGYDLKKILTRVIRQTGVKVVNRVMATRISSRRDGQWACWGLMCARALGSDPSQGRDPCVRRFGRLGLPASGYLYGTMKTRPTRAMAIRSRTTRAPSSLASSASRSTR